MDRPRLRVSSAKTCVNNSGLKPTLLNLVYLRASQITGCAWCIDMHTKDAPACEKPSSGCTKSARGGTLRVYEEAKKHFTDKELVNLTLAITQINVWNRRGQVDFEQSSQSQQL